MKFPQAMTASIAVGCVLTRIVNEVRRISRVVYDVTSKPPGTIEREQRGNGSNSVVLAAIYAAVLPSWSATAAKYFNATSRKAEQRFARSPAQFPARRYGLVSR